MSLENLSLQLWTDLSGVIFIVLPLWDSTVTTVSSITFCLHVWRCQCVDQMYPLNVDERGLVWMLKENKVRKFHNKTKVEMLKQWSNIGILFTHTTSHSHSGQGEWMVLVQHRPVCCSLCNSCTAVSGYVTPLSVYVCTWRVHVSGKAWKTRNRNDRRLFGSILAAMSSQNSCYSC